MKRVVDKILDFLEGPFCAALFGVVVILVLIQVVFRAIGVSSSWTEEIARYLNVWAIYIGCSRCVRDSKHLSVDILPLALHGKAKVWLSIVVDVISLVFFVYVAYFGVQMLNGLVLHPQKSASVQINMIYPYAAPVFGTILMVIRTIEKIFEHSAELRENKKELEGGEA